MSIRVTLFDRTVTLDGTLFKLGRDESNDVVLTSRSVSRHHCELRVEGGAISCLDRSSAGTAILEGEQSVRLTPNTWTNVPLDAMGRGVLVLGGIEVCIEIVRGANGVSTNTEQPLVDAAGARGTLEIREAARQGLEAAPARDVTPATPVPDTAASRPVAAPAPRVARRGPGADLVERLIADGDFDPTEPVAGSAMLARLLEVILDIARGLSALDCRFEANERRHGLTNPLRSVIASRDPTAWVRALASDKTGAPLAARLAEALAIVGRREDALLAAFTGGVRDLLAELDPARGGIGRRGGLGIVLDKSLRDYAAFFKEVSEGGWREIVLGRSFVSRFEQGVARDEER